MSGKAIIIRSDARNLPLPDSSVDLIVTSPPYFGLRSYRDNGEHYEGQVGSEATPQEFLQALWGCMQEWWRVLKPEGSCFVNLGDKRAGSGGHNNSGLANGASSKSTLGHHKGGGGPWAEGLTPQLRATRRNAPDRYNQASFGRTKSKMLIPHRFAIGCEDGLADPQGIGWVMRQDLIWQKLNGLPESVTDRHRDSHEYIFHFTKQERYFAAMDEIREPQFDRARPNGPQRGEKDQISSKRDVSSGQGATHRSFAVTEIAYNPLGKLPGSVWPMASEPLLIPQWAKDRYGLGDHFAAFPTELPRKLILGFSPQEGLVLDPFGGTGTVAMVAKGLGRIGISNDLSQDYCNLARWRIEESGHGKKAEQRTWGERQETFL